MGDIMNITGRSFLATHMDDLFISNRSSNDVISRLEFTVHFLILPLVSLLGIFRNVLSCLILYKHGLHKCSNILIFSLAVADTLYLVGANNVGQLIYTKLGGVQDLGFHTTPELARVIFSCFIVQNCSKHLGLLVSSLLPVVITLERVVAVVKPFHFQRIFTAHRIRVVVVVLYSLYLPLNFHHFMLCRLECDSQHNGPETICLMLKTSLYLKQMHIISICNKIYFVFTGPVPVCLVLIGCGLLSTHIRNASRKRQRLQNGGTYNRDSDMPVFNHMRKKSMGIKYFFNRNSISQLYTVDFSNFDTLDCITGSKYGRSRQQITSSPHKFDVARPHSTARPPFQPTAAQLPNQQIAQLSSQPSTAHLPTQPTMQRKLISRTTFMLLSVCFMYSITVGSHSFAVCVLDYQTWDQDKGFVISIFSDLVLALNSTFNFFIYVTLNKNFRETYRQICPCCFSSLFKRK